MDWRTAVAGMRHARLLGAALAAVGLLGGCAASHIGSDWPCPLAQGSPCLSVSAADPARAPAPQGAGSPQSAGTQQGAGARQAAAPRQAVETAIHRAAERHRTRESERAAKCTQGCRPSEWLERLGGRPSAESGGAEPDGDDAPADIGTEEGDETSMDGNPPVRQPPGDVLLSAGQRTAERIGRIWIGPYVDGSGVYREASWVRVVIEPARWRLSP